MEKMQQEINTLKLQNTKQQQTAAATSANAAVAPPNNRTHNAAPQDADWQLVASRKLD